MKKIASFLLVCVLAIACMSPAFAYVRRGTVNIDVAHHEIAVRKDCVVKVDYVIDPMSDEQLDGCGMSDCPECCGENCLSKKGDCTCSSTTYESYDASVEVSSEDESIATVIDSSETCCSDKQQVWITGVEVGETTVNVAARLREYIGSSEDIVVKVFPEDAAPLLQNVVVIPACEGTEETQSVTFEMTFDKGVADMSIEDFAMLHLGEPVEAEHLSLAVEGGVASLTVSVAAIKAGVFEIEYNGAEAVPFAVHAIVSPGMKLEVVERNHRKPYVTVRVSDVFTVRGIGRLVLTENGKVIKTQDENQNPFTGVHGHEFLTMDAETIAEKVVFALGETYTEGYEFSCEGDTVTITKIGETDGDVVLNLQVQQSIEIEYKD